MKSNNSGSSVALFSECPSKEEKNRSRDHVYGRQLKEMLDRLEQEEGGEESGLRTEKKRRLSPNQVKALEKYFELENKLEPERKTKLAEELGLQPRQVAVWFQNRRARWKTKQLERDFDLLRASYDTLKLECHNLEHDNENLIAQVRELKKKLHLETEESNNLSISMEESPISASLNYPSAQCKTRSHDMNENNYCDTTAIEPYRDTPVGTTHDNGSNKEFSNVKGDEPRQLLLTMPAPLSCPDYNSYCCSPSTITPPMLNRLHIANSRQQPSLFIRTEQQQQSVMIGEDSCNYFSVNQAPSIMNCYFPEQEQ